jgi:hypothetical protein
VKESGDYRDLLNGAIFSRWYGLSNPRSGIEGEARVVMFPLDHPWDREVAAAAGCHMFRYQPDPQTQTTTRVGTFATLDAMRAVPCSFIAACDESRELQESDRLMVFRQVLLLYEQTRAYWMDRSVPDEVDMRQSAYTKNTAILRERVKALEAKLAVPASAPAT